MTSVEANGGGGSGQTAHWVGSVEGAPIAEVLRRVAIEERSGDLQVKSPTATKTVYFDQGFIVFASSSLKGDRLGESMIEAGRISRREFALATELMEEGRRKFGQALVKAGIVSEEELGRHVAAQVNRIVLSLFSLRQGTYSFDERTCSIPLELMVSLSVYRILFDGIRRMRSKRLVITGLPPLDTKLSIVETPPFTMDFYRLHSEERALLRLVREGKTLREIAGAIGGHEGVVLRACYALISAGVIETVTPGAESRPRRVQEETGTFMLSGIQRKVAKEPEEAEARQAPVEPELKKEIQEPEQPPEPVPSPLVSEKEAPREVSVADTPEESVATGWSLSRLISEAVELVKRALLRPVRRLFGREPEFPETSGTGRRPLRHVPVRARVSEKVPVVPAMPPEEQRARPSSEEMSEDQLVMEIIGIPSWSVKDDPGDPVDLSAELFKGEAKEEPVDDHLGVPKWSVMDDPNDRRPAPSMTFLEDEAAPETKGEDLGSPEWSIVDRSDDGEEPPVSQAKEASPAPGRELLPEIELELDEPAVGDPASQSLESLDSDLFAEGDAGFDEQPSMLHHIPVEEISFEEASPEEIEIEIEEESFTHHPEPAPKPSSSPVGEMKSPSRPVSMPQESFRPEGYALSPRVEEDEQEPAVSPDEQSLRAKRLGLEEGGEDRLLRDIKLHFQHKDWAGAVRLLEDLVEISPGSAFYRGLLARAMSRHPVLRQNAEQHFIEALRLSPQDAQLHYWLGLYYKSYGLKSRAVNEFRTTLRIDPTHKGARQQFAAGGKRGDALGNVLKRFFG